MIAVFRFLMIILLVGGATWLPCDCEASCPAHLGSRSRCSRYRACGRAGSGAEKNRRQTSGVPKDSVAEERVAAEIEATVFK
ncbi:hypothetical protein NDU88_000991 [Pleurodeles waltl]|uniref:Secreted protein n=1 Tax=Pleurodeles waltl TaxID=8319 RepID=A0AAV7V939_PLEWA|nr:hypothetical protein NDU88_000991 [Pleurodeles waltl]